MHLRKRSPNARARTRYDTQDATQTKKPTVLPVKECAIVDANGCGIQMSGSGFGFKTFPYIKILIELSICPTNLNFS